MVTRIQPAVSDPEAARAVTALLGQLPDTEAVVPAADSGLLLDTLAQQAAESVEALPEVVLVHESVGPLPALELIREVALRFPAVAVVLLTRDTGAALYSAAMDAGARGVVGLPATYDELAARVGPAATWAAGVRRHLGGTGGGGGAAAGPGGTVVAVAGAKGGVGTTLTAVQLALAAQASGRRTALVDMDLQSGDVASYLDVQFRRSVADLAGIRDISPRVLEDAVYTHESGLALLLAPGEGERGEEVDDRAARQILAAVRGRYEVVVVDCGTQMHAGNAAAVETAERAVLITTPDVVSVRAAKRMVRLWDRLRVRQAEQTVALVNRASRASEIQPPLIARIVGTPVARATVPANYKELQTAVDAGRMQDLDSRSSVKQALWGFAGELGLVAAESDASAGSPGAGPSGAGRGGSGGGPGGARGRGFGRGAGKALGRQRKGGKGDSGGRGDRGGKGDSAQQALPQAGSADAPAALPPGTPPGTSLSGGQGGAAGGGAAPQLGSAAPESPGLTPVAPPTTQATQPTLTTQPTYAHPAPAHPAPAYPVPAYPVPGHPAPGHPSSVQPASAYPASGQGAATDPGAPGQSAPAPRPGDRPSDTQPTHVPDAAPSVEERPVTDPWAEDATDPQDGPATEQGPTGHPAHPAHPTHPTPPASAAPHDQATASGSRGRFGSDRGAIRLGPRRRARRAGGSRTGSRTGPRGEDGEGEGEGRADGSGRRARSRRWRGERGAATVEFTGMAPIVLVVAALLWQCVLIGYTFSLAGNAADEGARAATAAAADGDPGAACRSAATEHLPDAWGSRATVDCGLSGHLWKAEVRLTTPILFPGAAHLPFSLTGSAGAAEEG